MATTYKIVPEHRPGMGKWAIELVIDGKPVTGRLGAPSIVTKEIAQHWVEALSALHEAGDHL